LTKVVKLHLTFGTRRAQTYWMKKMMKALSSLYRIRKMINLFLKTNLFESRGSKVPKKCLQQKSPNICLDQKLCYLSQNLAFNVMIKRLSPYVLIK
jgi:hypothetical protein